MITSVLIANRGEIARRIMATCRQRGMSTVAVFSDADQGAPHAREADAAVRLPGVTPSDTYLRGDLIIDAARRAGADAIHPGYGFLSENADFARAVRDAGLTWIGPGPDAIDVMGRKIEAKKLMADAGVPVLDDLDPDSIAADQLPVLVKASAGGGGRGMRVVRTLDDLPSAVAAASREAQSAFGDPTVFCERYLESGHHVEVQVMADAHGTTWALGERECSIQRRHQKVIEEAPSPLVDRLGGDLRELLLAAGRNAAGAVGYVGAGTVEFLATDDGEFWFLEMNTRLQVEHPVTECVTGTDLVGLQLDVAAGKPLTGDEPVMTGHAVEARLYAEDPAADWQPQTGTIERFDLPADVRVDSGVEAGSVVGVHYDAMLAKVIASAPTREEAVRSLAGSLRRSRIHGVTTNRDLLVASLLHPTFLDGTADTGFFSAHPPEDLLDGQGLDPTLGALVAAVADSSAAQTGPLRHVSSGFRNVPSGYRTRTYAVGDDHIAVHYRFEHDGLHVEAPPAGVASVRLVAATPETVTLDLDGLERTWSVGSYDELIVVDGPTGSVALRRVPRVVDPSSQLAAGAVVAPMPGSVIRVDVAAGDRVAAGQPLVWLEAMKMEHAIHAAADGVVTEVDVAVGDQVGPGATLVVVSPLVEPGERSETESRPTQ